MTTATAKRYIIVAALEMETPELEQLAPVVHTGVGKVNAAIKLYEAILLHKPDFVVNYGTAGAITKQSGLLKVNTFIQRDMDTRGIGTARGVTPFGETDVLPKAHGIVLGSGDSFVTDPVAELEGLEIALDLIDMEAFALKEVCDHLGMPFECYKFVSDDTNEDSSSDWAENVAKGAVLFKAFAEENIGRSALL
ncbi:5'-methylthioadenosine nucleosidase [Leucothrix arctica]|uniref:5'-methylthioadenosine nucleosidase n=1 Tax=Leucothrix arctica TaxID=1481894 RepID=A0A317CH83_9GAMM|nr:5'-methylthioadenosine nucleosidase [Leucothrix arctica]PWQ97914.1 5'-methylthioadenosine nucleosidase [Leucothrix arctica]